ncbi:TPA: hypothetical protein RHK77_000486 [Enterococcus faecalis]|nr:hypothetical protein [Enterococcus faecalis]
MKQNDPLSDTDFFNINGKYLFVRTYSKNPNRLFHFSISRKDGKKTPEHFIQKLLNTNLVNSDLVNRYEIKLFVSEQNVTHLFCGSLKK